MDSSCSFDDFAHFVSLVFGVILVIVLLIALHFIGDHFREHFYNCLLITVKLWSCDFYFLHRRYERVKI